MRTNIFAAIDFETATRHAYSACSVGIVLVENGKIVDEYYSLIYPPENRYEFFNSKVHGIKAHHTINAPSFLEVYPEIKKLLTKGHVVAHNEQFDRNVLAKTMLYHDIIDPEIPIRYPWLCTAKIYRAKNEGRAGLAACSKRYDIPLDHHNALSDARACAYLYHIHKNPLFRLEELSKSS